MSIEFTISFDDKELKSLLNTLLNIEKPTRAQERIGHKLEYILENMARDEAIDKDDL